MCHKNNNKLHVPKIGKYDHIWGFHSKIQKL